MLDSVYIFKGVLIIYFVENLNGYIGQGVGGKIVIVKDDPRLLGLST